MTILTNPSQLETTSRWPSFAGVPQVWKRLQFWLLQRRHRYAERRAAARLRAEIADPRLLADVGVAAASNHLERYLRATLDQQH